MSWFAAAAPYLQYAGMAVSAIGSLTEGSQVASAEEMNAQLARQQAEFNAAQKRKETQRLIAKQRAGFGASGVQTDVGTPLIVAEETAGEGELDALMEIYGGESEARIREARASSARTSGYMGAGESILQGAGTFASNMSTSKTAAPTATAQPFRAKPNQFYPGSGPYSR